MAIGRTFCEALQKAVRMLRVEAELCLPPVMVSGSEEEISKPTDYRLFALYRYFQLGGSVQRAQEITKIDAWFLSHLCAITQIETVLRRKKLTPKFLDHAKKYGFSDRVIASWKKISEERVRSLRIAAGIVPRVKQIDTLAGEFPASTNYLYCTYHGTTNDIPSAPNGSVFVLGSGPYSIGSSVEFDWCAVNTVRTLREMKKYSIMINSNPETVSTDYDESDRLYFEELTEERVRDILDFEKPAGVVVSVGGQIANTMALPLFHKGYPILGTSPLSIDRAEDREKFSALLSTLSIDQPSWERVTSAAKARAFARKVGYPLLIRPSYVLSGAAMNVVATDDELLASIEKAHAVSEQRSIVLTRFIRGAKELEIDGVAQDGIILAQAMTEHVEQAGVHSGDATVILPPQNVYLETVRRAKEIARSLVRALRISGPFNIQFLAKENQLKVIECNVRASRSFPFVSKVTHINFIRIAVEVFLGIVHARDYETLELPYVGVKIPQFSYRRLKGADPVATVEMASTGEVACIGDSLVEAFFCAWKAAGNSIKKKAVFVSLGGMYAKAKLVSGIRAAEQQGWEIYATQGTHQYLSERGIGCYFAYQESDGLAPTLGDFIKKDRIGVIINIPRKNGNNHTTDGYALRQLAIENDIPLITNVQVARLFLQSVSELEGRKPLIHSWQEYMRKNHPLPFLSLNKGEQRVSRTSSPPSYYINSADT